MSSYARIIVDVAHAQVDRLFTYRVPDGMEVQPGHRVRVPFGPRNIEGFVLELADDAGDIEASRIRDILAAADPEPVILPTLVKLALWIKAEYHCLLVDALRLMIPSQMRGDRVRAKTRLAAYLCVEGEAFDEAVRSCARAPRQIEALYLLSEANGDPLLLYTVDSAVAAALRTLEKKGYVRIEEYHVNRRPVGEALGGGDIAPTHMQKRAIEAVCTAVDEGGGAFLLHGVTGSGKTEVYIHIIRHVLSVGKAAIVLVPEIALTPQMVGWFRARFGDNAAVLHSRLSPGERFDEWQRIRSGEAQVVVGARSAVFAPVRDLGLIVIDEEHEGSYQSGSVPQYDARVVARERCSYEGAALLLGSATPSLLSYARAMRGHMELIELPDRVNGKPLPEVTIVDMRQELLDGNKSIFSNLMLRGLRETFEAGEQAMLLLNRRGHSTFVSCRACGEAIRCEHCDITMTYHRHEDMLRCHYCDASSAPPKTCPQCGSPYIRFFGTGTQKVEEEFRSFFSNTKILRMDYDTTRGKDSHLEILKAFREGEAQLLIGTQMIAKGHDFPNVTLVGIVAADLSLNVPDYRSEERTFQLLTQMAGRAGRGNLQGQVIIQTYDPEHYAVAYAARQDYRAFYHTEMNRRKKGLHPPYTTVGRLLVTGTSQTLVASTAELLGGQLEDALHENPAWDRQCVQTRAMEAPLGRMRDEYRWQVYIKLYAKGETAPIWDFMRGIAQSREDVRVVLEIDPQNML